MKTRLWSVLVAGVIGVGLMSTLAAEEMKAPETKAPEAKAQESEKVVFTFSDDAQMQQFGQLWQQRQATITKMAVLQSYWNLEQQGLNKLNAQFSKDYNIDVNKNYQFDPKRKVLIEVAGPPPGAAAAAQPGGQAQAPQAAPSGTAPAKP